MKLKIFITIVFFIAIALIALAITKPNKNAHYEVVRKAAVEVLNNKIAEANLPAEYASIGTMTATSIIDNYLQANLILREHTFYTLGFINYNECFFPVSIGFLGQVYLVVDENDINKFLEIPELKQLQDMKSLLEHLE